MTQKGAHTWDLIIHYHRCPNCGYIVENREDFRYILGDWIKDVTCERCHHEFVVKKKNKPTFGPLIGTAQPPEVNWE